MTTSSHKLTPAELADIGKLARFTELLPGFVYQLYMDVNGQFSYPYASSAIADMFGVTAEQVKDDASALLDKIHPDDIDEVMATSLQAAEHEGIWHSQFRMIVDDGQIIWIEAYDQAQKLEDGSVLWTGYANDITARKQLEAQLKESEAKFRAFVENANDIIYALDPEGRITYVSPQWTTLLGHDQDSVIGQSFEAYVHPDDIAGCYAFLTKIVETGIKQSGIEYRIKHINGDWQWHTSNASPIFDEQGNVIKYLGIGRDITERKRLDVQISRMAHYDQLTNIANRALFFELLNQQLLQSKRHHFAVALLFVDLDKFKPVNDNHGHAIGDQLLIQVAERLQQQVRASDAVGRIGGDEFVVMLTSLPTDKGGLTLAADIAEKIRARLAEPFVLENAPQPITASISASIGIALCPHHAQTAQELSKLADNAMYLAKREGRNTVMMSR